jgi:hypothetical protein
MAQHQTVVLIDDLDGSPAEQTVAFSVDGQQYEIDLSRQNLQRLHDTLAPYLTAARKVDPGPSADRQARRPRIATPAMQAARTGTPPAEVATSKTSTTQAPRPPVPVALFSNPDEHLPSHTAAGPKPHTAGLFSAVG